MSDKHEMDSLLQKYSLHVTLLMLVGVFLVGAGLIGLWSNRDTAVATTSSSATNTWTNEPTHLQSNPSGNQGEGNLTTINNLDPNIPILADSSLSPQLDPKTFVGKKPSHNFPTYVVESGDAPANIADRFGITTATILGGNPQLSNEASALQTGVELVILPMDGVLHNVQRGETLESISASYGVSVEEIIGYTDNNLEFPYRLYEDTQIFVPGAIPDVGFVWNPPSLASIRGNNSLDIGGGNNNFAVQGTGSHQWPIGTRGISQNYWFGHQAIDVTAAIGTAVVASDRGTVTWASWNVYCFGNLVVVNHGNGYETFYAHLDSISVTPGQVVEKGQFLGTSGNTGCSSGPHLHYEIRFNTARDNPLNYLP
jgi:LysM repeat protein